MFIDIRKTAEGHSSADAVLSFPEELQDAGQVVGEFPATVTVSRYNDYLFVKIAYVGKVAANCGRCLTDFTVEVAGEAEFTIQSKDAEDMGSDEIDTYIYETEDDQIDFSQSVYDDMMTRVPAQPVCDSTCAGFTNPTEAPEEEEVEEQETAVDPRWAALGKLKQ